QHLESTSLSLNTLPVHRVDAPLWKREPLTVCKDLAAVAKKDTTEHDMRTSFHTLVHTKFIGWCQIFTDGSKDDSHVGSAFVCQRCDHSHSESLSLRTSIFTAELKAISAALDHIAEVMHQRTVIFTDSLSSVQAFESPDPDRHF